MKVINTPIYQCAECLDQLSSILDTKSQQITYSHEYVYGKCSQEKEFFTLLLHQFITEL